jgi:hypothetical protein
MSKLASIIFSFSTGVIFGIFGSSSLYYFLSFLVIEIIWFIYNKNFDAQFRLNVILASIFGYIICRSLINEQLFSDF